MQCNPGRRVNLNFRAGFLCAKYCRFRWSGDGVAAGGNCGLGPRGGGGHGGGGHVRSAGHSGGGGYRGGGGGGYRGGGGGGYRAVVAVLRGGGGYYRGGGGLPRWRLLSRWLRRWYGGVGLGYYPGYYGYYDPYAYADPYYDPYAYRPLRYAVRIRVWLRALGGNHGSRLSGYYGGGADTMAADESAVAGTTRYRGHR